MGGLFDYSVYSWPIFNQKDHGRTGELLKSFWWVGEVGGLLDYSVYPWPIFYQKWNLTMVGPG